jgi:signal transduction histidine kinase
LPGKKQTTIIEMQGGAISARSEESGKGTAFVIELPTSVRVVS